MGSSGFTCALVLGYPEKNKNFPNSYEPKTFPVFNIMSFIYIMSTNLETG